MIILLDLDGTVVDLHRPWLAAAAACCGPTPPATLATMVARYNGPADLPCGQHVFDHLTGALYRSLPPLPGAIAAIHALEADGHEVLAVTASAKDPDTAAAKLEWCDRWLRWSRHRVIIAQRKDLVCGSVLVDDAPANLTAWAERWGRNAMPLTIGYPYNAHLPDHWRCGSFEDPAAAWATIVERIRAWNLLPPF